jgi:hypothetical protein
MKIENKLKLNTIRATIIKSAPIGYEQNCCSYIINIEISNVFLEYSVNVYII